MNSGSKRISQRDGFLASAIEAMEALGKKIASRRRVLKYSLGALVLSLLAAASSFVVRLLTQEYQVDLDTDYWAFGALILFLLIAGRLIFSAGKLLNAGLASAVTKIAGELAAPTAADRSDAARRISKRMTRAAEEHRAEVQCGVSNLVILFIVSAAILMTGKFAIDQEWFRFAVTTGETERRFAATLAGVFAFVLLMLGRGESLSQEEAFHKKIMGYIFGAIDDENLSGVGGPALARALQAIDSRHRRSAAARLSYDAVRKRLGI